MRKWIIVAVVVLLAAAGAATLFKFGPFASQTPVSPTEAPVLAGTQIVAEGRVVPVRQATLSFASGGIVAEVFVEEGDPVTAGQIIARLDSSQQQAAIDQAEAALAEAQAADQQLRAGARPEQVAVAAAQLEQAEAQLLQTTGSVTDADIAAARAQLRSATDRVRQLRSGATPAELQQADAALYQAQAALTTERDRLSAAKTDARLQLERATAALTSAQQAYATAKANWEFVMETGQDPTNPESTNPANPQEKIKNKLNDTQRQQYYDAFVERESALRSAEAAVQQMLVAYDTARQAEVSGVQQAEQSVMQSTAARDDVRAAVEPDVISAAQAAVVGAQANLSHMQGDQRAGALAAAGAAVAQARANLALLQAPPRDSDLLASQARLQRAQAELRAAQLARQALELKAPFAGSIASVDIEVTEYAAPGQAIARIADGSRWQIETTDLTELNIADVREGAPAELTFDALPGVTVSGRVARIRAYGENKQGDITYLVLIEPDSVQAGLRWNMTAAVTIHPD